MSKKIKKDLKVNEKKQIKKIIKLENKPKRLDAVLKKVYQNPEHPASFSSPAKLYKYAKMNDKNIKISDVKQWIQGQRSYTLHKSVVNKFPRRKVLVRGVNHQYQADLLDFQPLAKDNSGMRYILTVIDCFSRFASAIPIKAKTGKNVLSALIKSFKFMKPPNKLQTDRGTEFYNYLVRDHLKKHKIVHFSTFQELKAQIVERFNRTLRTKIMKYMTSKGTLRYVEVLPKLIEGYNSSPHTSLGGYAPKSVNKKNEMLLHEIQYGEYLKEKRKKFKFQINDKVRIISFNKQYKKNFTNIFRDEFFLISNQINSNPPMYQVRDIKDNQLMNGTFYESQLQIIQLPQK